MSNESDEDKVRARLAHGCALISSKIDGLDERDGTVRLAIVQRKPDGSGRIVYEFDTDIITDATLLAGPDIRTDDEKAADELLVQMGNPKWAN